MEETKGYVYAWIVLENDVRLQKNGIITIVTSPNQRTPPEKQMQICPDTKN